MSRYASGAAHIEPHDWRSRTRSLRGRQYKQPETPEPPPPPPRPGLGSRILRALNRQPHTSAAASAPPPLPEQEKLPPSPPPTEPAADKPISTSSEPPAPAPEETKHGCLDNSVALRARFLRRVLGIQMLLFGITDLVSWLLAGSSAVEEVFDAHAWVYIICILSAMLVMLIYSQLAVETYRPGSQIAVLCAIMLTMIFVTLSITLALHTPAILRSLSLTLIILGGLWLLSLQGCVYLPLSLLAIVILGAAATGLVLLVWMPESDFFSHPGQDWVHPPNRILDTALPLLMSTVFSLYLLYMVHLHEKVPKPRTTWLSALTTSIHVYTFTMKLVLACVLALNTCSVRMQEAPWPECCKRRVVSREGAEVAAARTS